MLQVSGFRCSLLTTGKTRNDEKSEKRKKIFYLALLRMRCAQTRVSHGDVTVNLLCHVENGLDFFPSLFGFKLLHSVSRLLPPSVHCHKLLNSYLWQKFPLETYRSRFTRALLFRFYFSRTKSIRVLLASTEIRWSINRNKTLQ